MVNLTLSEATLNAVRAALDERVARLERKIQRHTLTADDIKYGVTLTEDAQRALVWNIAALHETKTAVEDFAEVNCTDHPAEATWEAWTQGELVAVFGK